MPAAPTSLGSWAARLRAVPAVHFRVAFAEEVHRLCADPATRPEAIAVELGPATAAAALDWLRELGVGSGQRVALPCMLGLTKANRFLHPSTRDLARELQETSGLELHELPPQLLHELLGYCAVSLLPLSPTDSIIEALRCALELEAPVYAVDLEDSAARERAATMLEDPSLASGRVDAYVQRMERPARAHRDPDVDDRREAVMASRLSAVLAAHERVLFTGGLAHWLAIRELLQDPGLAPAPAPPVEPATDDAFTRVIVHPSLAIRHMDLFPFVTELYEEQRRPANERSRRPLQLDVQHELGAMLQEAYGLFFRCTGPQDQLDRSQEDCETKPDFERFLTNLCTVKGLAVPDLFHTLAAAQGMMTDAFCRELAEVLMRFTWATPDDQLDLPILAPDSTGERSGTRATYVSRDGSRSRTFYIDDEALRGSSSVAVPAPREWEEHEPREKTAEEYSKDRRVWEPSEYLFTAFSLRAAQIAEGAADERTIEPFEGSLREGLDPKATLRGEIHGEKRPYVRDILRRRKKAPDSQGDPFPVVWIFRLEEDPGTDWYANWGYRLQRFAPHVIRKDLLEQAMARGERLLEGVTYERRGPEPQSLRPQKELTRIDIQARVQFAPPHFSLKQAALWAEETAYERCPLVAMNSGDAGVAALKAAVAARYDIECDWSDWTTTAVRMAIAYARNAATVILPDGFVLPRALFSEARQRRVELRVAPLSFFPRRETRRITVIHTLPCKHEPESEFPPWAARELGESPTQYQDLIPERWRNYGLEGAERDAAG